VRLPDYSDLSEEQDSIYLDAPMDGTVFVTGPPGTGKTVIAFYRADVLAEKDPDSVTVAMYNRVLNQYTKNAALLKEKPNKTHSFYLILTTI